SLTGYVEEEFVAHTSTVNCLKIGKKSSRVLVTGGEDHKVNIWQIGKPNATASLSGHSSGIDSVSFDSSEVLVAAGAASGSIKIWDLEEAKIVRTFTGHRSNCISVGFHPFGEFFASGSLDTNLKIWDIRKKECIHTYKGHTRGVNATRFTPDGRWIVSGGGDNTVKLWDLTAGKLLHDFKCHEGQIQCIDFHPSEFLLATGSADRTVKFWDLETFELIGTAGTESSGVRCLTFNPDGRTLLCGLHESLKVCSWEPILCHDTVDVGWSTLSDLNVHEGKLLGCSYNQSCVGVWVVNISKIQPYAVHAHSKVPSEIKSASGGNLSVPTESSVKVGIGRLSASQSSDSNEKETNPVRRVSTPANPEYVDKDSKAVTSTASVPATPQRRILRTSPKNTATPTAIIATRRNAVRAQLTKSSNPYSKAEMVPTIVPSNDSRLNVGMRKEIFAERKNSITSLSRSSSLRGLSNANGESDGPVVTILPGSRTVKSLELGSIRNKNILSSVRSLSINLPASEHIQKDARSVGLIHENKSILEQDAGHQQGSYELRMHKTSKDASSYRIQRTGSIRSIAANWESKEKSPGYVSPATAIGGEPRLTSKMNFRCGYPSTSEKEPCSVSDEDVLADIFEKHEQFMSTIQARLTRLQIVQRYLVRNDIKTAIVVLEKMSDHGVVADVVSLLAERVDVVTLEICTVLLPLLSDLLESHIDRHLEVSLEMLVKLVRLFGSVIYSAISPLTPYVGVDIEAEQRLERCNLCFVELERAKRCLPSLTSRGMLVAKLAQELLFALTAAKE
ncbi:LOW QUALITY PROTEIN: hypothetical protein V2J09_005876, partial [Rumex salicifolius]